MDLLHMRYSEGIDAIPWISFVHIEPIVISLIFFAVTIKVTTVLLENDLLRNFCQRRSKQG